MPDLPAPSPRSELLIYQTEDGRTRIQVRLEDETVWLTQADMAQLFQTTPQNITLHLKNIFQEGELEEAATCKDFLQVQTEGERKVQRARKYYNLDAIISVGYRIKSQLLDVSRGFGVYWTPITGAFMLLRASKAWNEHHRDREETQDQSTGSESFIETQRAN